MVLKTMSAKANRTSAITYLVMVVVFASIKMLLHFGALEFLGEVGKEILGAAIQLVLLLALAIAAMSFSLKQKPVEVMRFYGYKKISWKGIALSFVLGIVVYVLNVFISSFFNAFLTAVGYNFPQGATMSAYPFWLLLINLVLTAVLPAVCEETAHRGMLLNGMAASKKRSTTIILTSILFGLLHCNITQFFYATLIGLLLGYISSVTENIYPAIIIHFTNNALSVFMGFSRFHNLGADMLFNYTDAFIENNAVLGILFVCALVGLLLFLLKFLVHTLFKKTILTQLHGLNNKVLIAMEKFDYMQDLETIKQTGETFQPTEMQDYSRFKSLFYSYGKEFGFTSKIKNKIGQEEVVEKDKIATALYITSLVILSALTIFSFVWNLLGV